MSSGPRRLLVAGVAAGVLLRIIWAFGTLGVEYDIESLDQVGRALLDDPLNVYVLGRWPYPAGLFPLVAAMRAIANATGLPFHGVIQLLPIAADAAIALVLAFEIRRHTGSDRQGLLAGLVVALGPVFVAVSGFHGQIDSVAILFALLGMIAWSRNEPNRGWVTGLLLGVGASIKVVPVFLLLALLPRATRRERIALITATAAVPFVLTIPFLLSTPRATISSLFANQGVPGLGGWSVILQPSLTGLYVDSHPVEATRLTVWLTQQQTVIVGIAVMAAGLLLWRRKPDALHGAVLIWLTVWVFNVNFAFQYMVWGLPFLLLAGRNRLAIGIQLLLLVPVIELYVFNGRANGPVFVFFMAMFCVTLVIAWVRDVSRIWRSGTPAPDVAISV